MATELECLFKIREIINEQINVETKQEQEVEPIDEIVKNLQSIKQPVQLSQEWFDTRKNMMTASDLSCALKITDSELEKAKNNIFELNSKQKLGSCCNPYNSLKQYIQKKCGLSKPFNGNEATRWGQMFEPLATQLYEIKTNENVIEFGLLPHPDISWLGASPDGITHKGIMLEIKCPMRRKITGVPPMYYWMQMQLQMEVCDLPFCDFEECDFVIFNSKQEFLDSELEDKGFIVEKSTYENTEYIYPTPGTYENQLKWIFEYWNENDMLLSNIFDNMYKFKKIYWGLRKYSCTRVQRDSDWFQSRFDDLKLVWNEVLYCRENGLREIYKTNTRKKKVITKIEYDFDL